MSPAAEDPFQLEGLEKRAPPLPEEKIPVASTAAANDVERQNGVSKSTEDASHAEVGWSPSMVLMPHLQLSSPAV